MSGGVDKGKEIRALLRAAESDSEISHDFAVRSERHTRHPRLKSSGADATEGARGVVG